MAAAADSEAAVGGVPAATSIASSAPQLSLLDLVYGEAPRIRDLALRDHNARVRVFGSVARGEERADTGIDLLVTPLPGMTHFDLARFQSDLESVFRRPIDLVIDRTLDETRDQAILDEAMAL